MNLRSVSSKLSVEKIILLLPVFPVIFFFIHNVNRFLEIIFTQEVLLLFFTYSLLALIIVAGFKKLLKQSLNFSIFIGTILIGGFVFFGVVQDFLLQIKKFQFLSNTFFLLASVTGIILSLFLFVRKKEKSLIKVNRFFAYLFLLLIALEAGIAGFKFISGKSIGAITSRMVKPIALNNDAMINEPPDIYYIVFDSYTSRTALKEYWNYDNDIYPFLNENGFYTIDSAFSNYKSTPFSISSSLNLQYLNGADAYQFSNSFNFLVGLRPYRNNILFRYLKNRNYSFSIFSQLESEELLTAFGFLGVEKPVTWLRNQTLERIYVDPWKWDKLKKIFRKGDNDYSITLKSMQKFDDYNKKAAGHLFSNCQAANQNNIKTPVFNFTHFMLPHNPYLIDENGNYTRTTSPDGGNMKGYVGQVKYANKLIRQITNCLLSDTTRNKIIIFQGDHGYRHFINAPVSKQFQSFNALYFYNKNYEGLRKNISNVNTFRIVLNNIFNNKLPLLKDSMVVVKEE